MSKITEALALFRSMVRSGESETPVSEAAYEAAVQEASLENHDLRDELRAIINQHSAENGSDTPDFILAEYLTGCLGAYDRALQAREKWYGRKVSGEPREERTR